jgi:SH3 domain protein
MKKYLLYCFIIPLCLPGVFVFHAAPPAHASTYYYVAPASEVPVRTGKSSRNKIVAVLADGTRVSVMERDNDWSRIRTESGREGWILHRYLTKEVPLSIKVTQLQKENQRLKDKLQKLLSGQEETGRLLDACDDNLTSCRISEETIRKKYIALQRDAAEVMQIKEMLKTNEEELSNTRSNLAATKEQLEIIENNSNIKWFLAGAGVLLAGWIIGAVTASRRKRRPSLL